MGCKALRVILVPRQRLGPRLAVLGALRPTQLLLQSLQGYRNGRVEPAGSTVPRPPNPNVAHCLGADPVGSCDGSSFALLFGERVRLEHADFSCLLIVEVRSPRSFFDA